MNEPAALGPVGVRAGTPSVDSGNDENIQEALYNSLIQVTNCRITQCKDVLRLFNWTSMNRIAQEFTREWIKLSAEQSHRLNAYNKLTFCWHFYFAWHYKANIYRPVRFYCYIYIILTPFQFWFFLINNHGKINLTI